MESKAIMLCKPKNFDHGKVTSFVPIHITRSATIFVTNVNWIFFCVILYLDGPRHYAYDISLRKKSTSIIKGHSQLWERADLNSTFASLKSVYLNPKSNIHLGIRFNPA